MGGILREELGGANAEGDEVTVVYDWAEVSAGETVENGGDRAGAELEVCGPLSGWVLRCKVGAVGEDPRDSARTVTIGRVGLLGEEVVRVRGTVKRRNEGDTPMNPHATHTGVLGLMSGHRLPWIFWGSDFWLVVRPQTRM